MIRVITDKDPQAFYRDVLECEAEEAPENDAQTSLMNLAGREGYCTRRSSMMILTTGLPPCISPVTWRF